MGGVEGCKSRGQEDAEKLKAEGNELYRAGKFQEAISKFDAAISKSPDVAVYRANKAAVLSSLGRLGEAVIESKKAVELDDTYARAHQRLANLYLRLGKFAEARQHFCRAGADSDDGEQLADRLEAHAQAAHSAREHGDWASVLHQADTAVQGGVDAESNLAALKAEALLNLRRPEEADKALVGAEKAATDAGSSADRDPALLALRANVSAATGAFEAALAAAERSVKLDPENPIAIQTLKQTRALVGTRTRGNDLFKIGDFPGAEKAYSEGLENPLGQGNAFLLSNRAAARSKQGRWEEALSDTEEAVRTCPNYSKAKLRRAHAYKGLGRWGDAVAGFEGLVAGAPNDLELAKELFEAKKELARSRGQDVSGWTFTPPGGLMEVKSEQQYWEKVKGPGLVVGYFTATWCGPCRQIAPVVKQLPEKYPGLTILKADIDSNQQLAAAEEVASVPTFKVYKNGRKIQEIAGANAPLLEQVIRKNL